MHSMIPQHIARQVLTIGPEYHNVKGGIGGVLNVYSKFFSPFKVITTYKVKNNKLLLIPLFLLSAIALAGTLLLDRKIRVVHIHGSSNGSFYRKLIIAFIAKGIFRKKIIYHIHSGGFNDFYLKSNRLSRSFIHYLLKKSDIVVGLSPYWKEYFESTFSLNNVHALGNVVIPADKDGNKEDPRDGKRLRLLFLGALVPSKGLYDLLEVLAENRSFFAQKLELVIGGIGDTDRLQTFIKEHSLEGLVRFEGWVSGESKTRLLREANLFVLPSYYEGLPMAILEAMSFDLPVLSTKVGGIPEVVEEGVNGYLINAGDKQAIFDRLQEVLNNPALTQEMGRASGQFVKAYYPDSIFPQLSGLYETLLDLKK